MFNKVVVNWQTIVKLNFKFCINKNPTGLPVGMSICESFKIGKEYIISFNKLNVMFKEKIKVLWIKKTGF